MIQKKGLFQKSCQSLVTDANTSRLVHVTNKSDNESESEAESQTTNDSHDAKNYTIVVGANTWHNASNPTNSQNDAADSLDTQSVASESSALSKNSFIAQNSFANDRRPAKRQKTGARKPKAPVWINKQSQKPILHSGHIWLYEYSEDKALYVVKVLQICKQVRNWEIYQQKCLVDGSSRALIKHLFEVRRVESNPQMMKLAVKCLNNINPHNYVSVNNCFLMQYTGSVTLGATIFNSAYGASGAANQEV